MISPVLAVENLRRLISKKLLRDYGFYEAIDYTPERLPENEKFAVVKSFMAHHQGMSLVALDNVLADKLGRQGLTFNQTDPASFKARLSSWYTKNKQSYGPTMWGLLEKYGEKLG